MYWKVVDVASGLPTTGLHYPPQSRKTHLFGVYMSPGEWTAVGGGALSVAGLIWGYAFAWGRQTTKVAEQDAKIAAQDELIKTMMDHFSKCQQRGLACSASMQILTEANNKRLIELQTDFAAHKAAVHAHHERNDIHTTAEWRQNVLSRLDRMEENVNEKLDTQTRTLVGRLENVEKLVRNGGGK